MPNRSRLRTDPLLLVFLIIVFGGGALLRYAGVKTQTTPPPVPEQPATPATAQEPGHLVFEHSFFDFGTVTEGDIVRHNFKFKNDGVGKVKLAKTETSCGCTTASSALKEYAPGESGEMEVVVDTKGKKGIVVKTVTLTLEDNNTEKVEVTLAMKLVPPPHPKNTNVRNINAEAACKSCHLESGEGETGIFLYHRVCSQCHGKKGAGGSAIALNNEAWQKLKMTDAELKKVIQSGMPDNGMPSFVDGVTPPLTDEQVDSLIQYIRSLIQR